MQTGRLFKGVLKKREQNMCCNLYRYTNEYIEYIFLNKDLDVYHRASLFFFARCL